MTTASVIPSTKSKLYGILNVISWSEISKNYFGKSNSWLYHKMNGIDGNGKPTTFNEEELETLRKALIDLSDKIKESAMNL